MPSLAAGTVSSLLASLHAWAERFLALATEEGKQAGLRLLSMLGLALLSALLAITGGLGLLAGVVLALVQNNIVGWGVALGIAALLSFAGAGGLALVILRRSQEPFFAATRRQFGPQRNLEIKVDDGSPPLVPHEQEVEEGRIAAYAEYEGVRNRLRRPPASPLIIGGGMLAGITVGYLVSGRRRLESPLDPARPGAWSLILGSLQVVTPLWIALRSATRPQAPAAQRPVPHTGGGAKAPAAARHES